MTLDPKLALVVEDDFLQRETLASFLRDESIDVVECATAEAGELVLARIGLELTYLITDVALAGAQTGLDLASFARVRFPNIKIIVVSGQRDLSIPLGIAFLEKPWLPRDLRRLTAL